MVHYSIIHYHIRLAKDFFLVYILHLISLLLINKQEKLLQWR